MRPSNFCWSLCMCARVLCALTIVWWCECATVGLHNIYFVFFLYLLPMRTWIQDKRQTFFFMLTQWLEVLKRIRQTVTRWWWWWRWWLKIVFETLLWSNGARLNGYLFTVCVPWIGLNHFVQTAKTNRTEWHTENVLGREGDSQLCQCVMHESCASNVLTFH